ncbi:hypothetical protein BDR04DRAFT_1120488 [Suillus decipiens]|nr:hypothetical protein BDR04DRAFT_1120488 [Suillus decipiens]
MMSKYGGQAYDSAPYHTTHLPMGRIGRSTSHEFDRYYPSDTSHSGNSFVDSASSLSHDSHPTSSLHTNFSCAYNHNEISLLKKDKYNLEEKVNKFQQQIVSLQQQVVSLKDSFNEMLRMAHEASTLIPAHNREDYEGMYYWDKDTWTKECHGGHEVFKVKRTDDAGSALYLVDEDGVVASEAIQQKICDQLHTLWFTLLKHGCAPTSWTKIDI